MKERILAVMEHEGLTPSKFAEAIGIQRSAMSHIISGRNNPSLDVLIKILERFTYVDSDWLLFGKGTMMREHVLTEPNLFTNTTIIPSNVQDSPEYRKEIKGLFCPENGPLFNYDRSNRHYDRPNLRELPSALHISTVVMAKRTVVIAGNAQKRGKSPFLRSKKRINICFVSDVSWSRKIRFLQ